MVIFVAEDLVEVYCPKRWPSQYDWQWYYPCNDDQFSALTSHFC